MKTFRFPRFTLFALLALPAFAQTPTFTVVDTTALNPIFGNAGKAVLAPQAVGFAGVAYGNNQFVAVVASTSETVIRWATSPDGTTWTPHSQPLPATYTTFQTSKVHFLNGKFIFFTGFGGGDGSVGGSTWCYYSDDGLTWTANMVTNIRINVAEFDASPTLYVAAASNGNQVASTDLVTWVSRPVVPNAVGFDHNDLAYSPSAGKFFSSINGFGGSTYSSTDAVTWTLIPSQSTPGGGQLEAGNGFLISTAGGSHYKSTDGVTFTKLTLTGTTNWFPPGGSPRYTSAGFVALGTNLANFKGGYMVSSDCVAWTAVGMVPDAPKADAGFIVRSYGFRDIAYGNGKYVAVGQDNQQAAFAIQNTPVIIALEAGPAPAPVTEPQSQAVTAGGSATLTTAATGTIQWQRNGANVSGANSGTLSLTNVQPANTGIYTAAITNGATTTLQHAIIGVSTTSKVIGTATEFSPNVPHPNGNVFDQILFSGSAAAFTADANLNQAIRASYIDLNNDIVQIEFAGAGTVSVVFDGSSGPAAPINYNQPTVTYLKGHAGIVITGANETTNLSIFTVGRATAFDPTGAYNILLAPNTTTNNPANNGSSLFTGKSATVYDGIADIAFVAISSTNGKFGGLRTAGASYFATKGLTGVYAPGVTFTGPLFVGDITASDAALPVLQVGSVSDARITGGDLLQTNGQAVQVSGITQLKFTAGTNSHGVLLTAQNNRAVLMQGTTNVTSQIVVNP